MIANTEFPIEMEATQCIDGVLAELLPFCPRRFAATGRMIAS